MEICEAGLEGIASAYSPMGGGVRSENVSSRAFRVSGLRQGRAVSRVSTSANRAGDQLSMSKGALPSLTDALCVSMTHAQALRSACFTVASAFTT